MREPGKTSSLQRGQNPIVDAATQSDQRPLHIDVPERPQNAAIAVPERQHLPYRLRPGDAPDGVVEAKDSRQPSWCQSMGAHWPHLPSIGKSFRSGGTENPSTSPLDCLDGQPGSTVDACRRSPASRRRLSLLRQRAFLPLSSRAARRTDGEPRGARRMCFS